MLNVSNNKYKGIFPTRVNIQLIFQGIVLSCLVFIGNMVPLILSIYLLPVKSALENHLDM